jgi:probable rRNA maturation factor
MAISFSTQNIEFNLKQKTRVRNWINTVVTKERKKTGTIVYCFTSDKFLLAMNKQYLKHNTYTDIITFDYSEGKKIAGEIFISIDRVKDNAKKFAVDFETELHRVIIHGILHLCGYGDKSKRASANMRKLENKALLVWSKM